MEPIDPIDVYKNPQDYLLYGNPIESARVEVRTRHASAEWADGSHEFRHVTRKPKTRKVLVRDYQADLGYVGTWCSTTSRSMDEMARTSWFVRWLEAAPREYEIPVE